MFPRTVARMASVQAVCQHLMRPTMPTETLLKEFTAYRFHGNVYTVVDADDCEEKLEVDAAFFQNVVRGALAHWPLVEAHLAPLLPHGWRVDKMESTTRSIVRCAAGEMLQLEEGAPKQVIIHEYLLVAHSFLNEKGAGFINAVLDKLYTRLRP